MLADFTRLDAVALLWFFAAWGAYNLLSDKSPRGLNRAMAAVRERWMQRMLARENRVMDSMLLGHLIGSVSFFASTTALLLAGLIGIFATAGDAHGVIADLGFVQPGTRRLFELKLLLLAGIFIYAFFSFTWALRQFNYTVALVGAAPPAVGDDGADAESAAGPAALLTLAVGSFNAGIRAYYFAFATLGWLAHPYAFMALTAGVVAVLARRQFASPAFHRIRRSAEAGE